jgi:hypothetical protein
MSFASLSVQQNYLWKRALMILVTLSTKMMIRSLPLSRTVAGERHQLHKLAQDPFQAVVEDVVQGEVTWLGPTFLRRPAPG